MSEMEALVLVWLIISTAVVFILRGPLGKALARRLEGKHAQSAETTELLEELHQQVADNEALQGRVAELEEEPFDPHVVTDLEVPRCITHAEQDLVPFVRDDPALVDLEPRRRVSGPAVGQVAQLALVPEVGATICRRGSPAGPRSTAATP